MATTKSETKTKTIVLTQPSRTLSLLVGKPTRLEESHANKLLKEYRDVVTEDEFRKMKSAK